MSNMLSTFPNFVTSDSLFQKMVDMGAPWTSQIGKSMDISYFTMSSGLKTPSFFVKQYTDAQGVPISQIIAQTLWDIYGANWTRLWDGYMSKYNPLDNYNLQETVDRDKTDTRTIDRTGSLSSTVDGTTNTTDVTNGTNNLEHGHKVDETDTTSQTVNESGTSALQHGENISTSGEVNEFNYGFNSTVHVPTSDQLTSGTEGHTGTDTTTTSGESTTDTDKTINQTHSGIDKTTTSSNETIDTTTKDTRSDTTTDNTTDDDTLNEKIVRQRQGNIGQNSYQELLRQEFELWKWNFYWQVFEDVDKFLCLDVYDMCSSVN